MTIQNTQQAFKQPTLEAMIGSQKQEYPKPSIPQEVTNPVEKEYSPIKNEAVPTIEAAVKNAEQTTKETEMNKTLSLNDRQTLALASNTTQNKIDAYKAGAGIESESDKAYLHLSGTQDRMDAQKELQTIQETYKQKQGFQVYAQHVGAMN